jgi:hypothetical protein
MVIVTAFQGAKSLTVRGALGKPNGLGQMKAGWSKLGDFFPEAGIYQKRRQYGRKHTVKMRHYIPTNPRTSRQQFFRDYFRSSVSIYHGLSEATLILYKKRASKYQYTAYNYYISEYTNVRPAHVGNVRCGYTKLGQKMYLEDNNEVIDRKRHLPFDLGSRGY